MIENTLLAKLLKHKMHYTSERHGIISNNIANISTPLERTKDLPAFEKTLKMSSPLFLKLTNPMHMIGKNKIYSYPIIYPVEGTDDKLNGNNISLDNESMKMNHNTIEHNKAISIYGKMLSLFNIAIGK